MESLCKLLKLRFTSRMPLLSSNQQCQSHGSEKPSFFLKKAQPTGFWGFIAFWALLGVRILGFIGFSDFFLFERAC